MNKEKRVLRINKKVLLWVFNKLKGPLRVLKRPLRATKRPRWGVMKRALRKTPATGSEEANSVAPL